MIPNDKPILRVSQVAKYINLSADRLRTYDEENLVVPYRGKNNVRLYSNDDVSWLEDLRILIIKEKLSISGFKELLRLSYALSDNNFDDFIKKQNKSNFWQVFSRIRKNPNYRKLKQFYFKQ